MTAIAPHSNPEQTTFVARQRDRRVALGELLVALTRTLGVRADVSLMRGAFEALLRRVVSVRSVHLRERNSRWTGRAAAGVESIALEVPGA